MSFVTHLRSLHANKKKPLKPLDNKRFIHFNTHLHVPVHGEVYSIQHYVIKFVRLVTDQWFSPGTPFSSTNKTDSYQSESKLINGVAGKTTGHVILI